jgi:alkylation response protein AidB-like acyl-CoA dehydrogenase
MVESVDVIDYFSSMAETNRVLLAHADKADQNDRAAAESLDAVRQAGVFALRTPLAFGGAWASTETTARCLTELGRACPSTAWIAGTCATGKNFVNSCFPESSSHEFFADPNALACGSGVPRGQGERLAEGVRVRGRWPNISGCEDATWAGLGLMVEGAFSMAVIPVADLTIERTWQMAGMRGTGSHTLVADLVIPNEQVAAFVPPSHHDLLLYDVTVLGPVVGAARGALDVVNAMSASDRKPFMSAYSRMGESPGARHWLAEATHLVNRAERTMFAGAREADSADLDEADGARLHLDMADAGRDCRNAVERMLDLHGPSGFNTANPLQRYWRDVSVGSRHPHLNTYLKWEDFGSALAVQH